MSTCLENLRVFPLPPLISPSTCVLIKIGQELVLQTGLSSSGATTAHLPQFPLPLRKLVNKSASSRVAVPSLCFINTFF